MRNNLKSFNQLTPREQEVLDILLQGNTNKEAGRLLGISPRTVEVHRVRILSKFGVSSGIELGYVCGRASAAGVQFPATMG
jgi:two-component system response regulator FixJ